MGWSSLCPRPQKGGLMGPCRLHPKLHVVCDWRVTRGDRSPSSLGLPFMDQSGTWLR